jgi:hypothetical protein
MIEGKRAQGSTDLGLVLLMSGAIPSAGAFVLGETLLWGASMSALRATDRFDIFSTGATTVKASPAVPGGHVPAYSSNSNSGVIKTATDLANASKSETGKGTTAVIRARITEVLDGHARISREDRYFSQLPMPNDNIIIANRRGSYDIMRVLYSEDASETTVYVRWIRHAKTALYQGAYQT